MPRREDQGRATAYPGVKRLGDGYLIRAKVKDRLTGKPKQAERFLSGVKLEEAVTERAELVAGLRAESASGAPERRTTLAEFGPFWMRSKLGTIDENTARRYADILDLHILPKFGASIVEEIRAADVQALVTSWSEQTEISRHTVRGWWRVLRMVLRDAVALLHLDRDPTLRIKIPEPPEEEEGANTATPAQLGRLLAVMQARFPGNHALIAALAFTGLRACHVAGWRWDEIDEARHTVQIRRRAYLGKVAPVSRKKRAPRETAVAPELLAILRAHRERLIRDQARGLEDGWVFPGRTGKPRRIHALYYAWKICAAEAGIEQRFTPHGLRRVFHDLARRDSASHVVVKALVGHVSDAQHEHYSSVGIEEKRAVVGNVVRLIQRSGADLGADRGSQKKRQRRRK